MTLFKLISRTILHFRGSGAATAAGIAITTAVICGALIIGDSLRCSLFKIVDDRLGNITHTITAGDRIFTQNLAQRLNRNDSIKAAPVLKTEAIASVQGEDLRVNKVQVWGVDNTFCNVTGADQLLFSFNEEDDAIISKNLSVRLQLVPRDFFMISIKRIGDIPSDTPFVTEDGQTISRRVKVKAIADNDNLGHFGMRTTQTSPYNVFVSLKWLNRITEQKGMANMIIVKSSGNLQTDKVKNIVKSSIVPEDLGLKVNAMKNTGEIRISSRRVFIDDILCNRLKTLFPQAEFNLTYFVNSITNTSNLSNTSNTSNINEFSSKKQLTPYSFVTATDRAGMNIAKDEVVVNKWLAEDLGIVKGDTLSLSYFVFGQLRNLTERRISLRVAGIISMQDSQKDSILMPELPGLTDAGNCRDWDTGIPVNLDNIRTKDEDYWNKYKGTPKAYISLSLGKQLWQNRFGSLTSVVVPANTCNIEKAESLISENSDPFSMEFKVNEVRKEGIAAAQQSEDFGQLFAGLGFFIIVSGLLLTVLLHNLSLKIRQDQLNLFASLGFPRALIRKIVMAEFFVITVCGAFAGVLISIGYSKLILMGLNHLWYDIVRTDSLSLHFNALTLGAGFIASVLLGMAVVYFGTSKQGIGSGSRPLNKSERSAGTKKVSASEKKSALNYVSVSKILAAGLLLTSITIIAYLTANLNSSNTFVWFGAGTLLLLSFLSGAYSFLYSDERSPLGKITIGRLSLKNLKRNPIRSLTIIVMLALGSFVIVVTGANRKGHTDSSLDKTNGTGGFMYMAESTIPVMRNLNNPDTRLEYGIPEGVNFVQFLSAYDDDASCLNLNRVANPRILAVDPMLLEGRFTFVSGNELLDIKNPWLTLISKTDGIVPAIADQTVIQWGLGKKIGDTLVYKNEKGENVKLLLVGGIANSVLQGNVIISQENFVKHFPASGGSNLFLIEVPVTEAQNLLEDNNRQLEEKLGSIFRDYGWEMQSTSEKLAEFNSVENTYLNIFFLMGAFGMLLGLGGFAIIIIKSMFERKKETALLRALGFHPKTIFLLYFNEYALLFAAGIIAGTLSAVIATLPTI